MGAGAAKTYVITFESTECAMDASDGLAAAAIHFRTLPTPLAISAGCGIALRIDADDEGVVRKAVAVIEGTECGAASGGTADGGAALFTVYQKVDEGYRRVAVP